MRGVTVAVLGTDELAGRLAKKGTVSDITLYDAKHGDAHLNLVAPTRYPEKPASLMAALDLADDILLTPASLDRWLGETVVACELFGKTTGFARAHPPVPAPSLRDLLARTALRGLEMSEGPEGVLREKLYARASSSAAGPLILPIDHAFPVKGVGTVLLGLVRSGELAVHDSLKAYPSDASVDVRSIQVHDVDVKRAPARIRVGLAVKGVEAAQAGRGTVLAPPGSLRVLAPGEAHSWVVGYHAFNKWTPRAGAVLHLFHALQDVVLRVDSAGEGTLAGRLEAPLALVPEQPMVLVDLDNKVQRFVGRAALAG